MAKSEKEEDSTIKEVQTILKTAVTQIMNNVSLNTINNNNYSVMRKYIHYNIELI